MGSENRRSARSVVSNIKRHTRRKFTSEEKIRIVLEGLKGEESIADLCRREGINPNTYYNWSKAFLEAGKRQLSGDTRREANSDDVSELRQDNTQLKHLVAELSMENRVLKKSLNGLE
jgi:transposase